MARGITEDEVWKACDALLLEGARPTIERVRQKLGRGSPNTVSPMLETWFKHLGTRIKDPGAFAAPPASPDPVQQAAQHLWEVAQAEARRDLDDRLREGLALAAANVEAEKERAAISEAAAFSAVSKATHLQAEIEDLRAALDAERNALLATRAQLEAAQYRVVDLQTGLSAVRQDVEAERARADLAIAAADERSAGAERRATLEIERERGLRAKEEKAATAIARKFEQALKDQISATEQLHAAEGRLSQLQEQAARREQEALASTRQQEARLQELERALAEARGALASFPAHGWVDEIVSKLAPVVEHRIQPAHAALGRNKPPTRPRKKQTK